MLTVQPSLKHYLNIPNRAQYVDQEATADSSNQSSTRPVESMCFEILGFDVLIDEKLKPWLIEINHAPSFATDTPFDFKIKKDVIADAVQLLGMSYKRKKKYIKCHKSHLQKRMMAKKLGSAQKVPKSIGKFGGTANKPNECQTVKKVATTKADGLVRTIHNRTTSARQRPLEPKSPPTLKADDIERGGKDGEITEENSESSSDDEKDEPADYEEGSGSEDDDCGHTNQYRLIFPSKRNPEEDYSAFMEYAQKCYDQFTGNYSRKQREEKAAARLAEMERERQEK